MHKNVNTSENINNRSAMTEGEIDKMIDKVGIDLKEYPKQTIIIPRVPGDKEEIIEVCLNGYVILIKKGVRVDLPEPIIEILQHAGLV